MSGLMNMVSKFTRGTRTTSGRAPRAQAPHAGGPRRGVGGTSRGNVGGTNSVEGMARRLLRRAR